MTDTTETPALHHHAEGAPIGTIGTAHLVGELTRTFRRAEGDRAGRRTEDAARLGLYQDRPLGPDHRHARRLL